MSTISRFAFSLIPAALFSVLLAAPTQAGSGNLVQNSGFEITDSSLVNIPDWTRTVTGDAIIKRRPGAANAHSGKNSAIFVFFGTDNGSAPGTATLSQNLAASPGVAYTISFWAEDLNADNPQTDPLQVSFGGTQRTVNLLNDAVIGSGSAFYTHYSIFGLTAANAATPLQFSANFQSAGNHDILLDDVGVNAVPEANTGIGLGVGLLGLGAALLWVRRRPRSA